MHQIATQYIPKWASNCTSQSKQKGDVYLSSLLTKSPNPGVSTTLSLNRTPFSSMSALIALILTVCGTSTEVGPLPFRGAYKLALNKVLTKVDFPNPDSPTHRKYKKSKGRGRLTYQQP